MPGITQKELVRLFVLRQSTLAYQMEKRGRRVRCIAKDCGKRN